VHGHKINVGMPVALQPVRDIRISNQFLITRALHFAQLYKSLDISEEVRE